MATGINLSRVARWCIALGGIACLFALAIYVISSSRSRPAAERLSCKPLPAQVEWVGPALTPSQLTGKSAVRSKESFFPLYFPFGRSDAEWRLFRQGLGTDKSVHEFTTPFSGVYLILRQQCFVDRIVLWVE